MLKFALLTSAALVAASVTNAAETEARDYPQATSVIKNLDGATIGNATLTQSPAGVLVHVRVAEMDPGKKGIHLHAKAHCTSESGFKSSHGHHGEAKGAHGLLNPAGPGAGDLGNIFVGTDGVGEMEFFKADVSLRGGDLPLFDADGSAIVIHANADDHLSQPIGGAGPRLACGTIEPLS